MQRYKTKKIKILAASLSIPGALILGSIVACLAFWWWRLKKSETKEKSLINDNLEREAGPTSRGVGRKIFLGAEIKF